MAFCSCDKKIEQTSGDVETGRFIRFTSIVEGPNARAAGATWAAGDEIGVYMKKSGEALGTNFIVNEGSNIEYFTTNGDGNFMPASTCLSFPDDGSKVDFIAYYPYKETINDFTYPVDVINQADPELIDLLYADGLKGIEQRSNALNLSFSHRLPRLVLNIRSEDGSSLYGLAVSIFGVKTKGSFSLADGTLDIDATSGGVVEMHMVRGEGLVAEAILLPEGNLTGVRLVFEQAEKTKEQSLDNIKLEKGTTCTYTVNLKNGELQIDPEAQYTKWRETPLITKSQLENPNIMYVVHDMPNAMKDPVSKKTLRNYALLYDTNLKFAYWVAYPLFAAAIGDAGRNSSWGYDPSIAQKLQANLSSGFDGGAVYDRGHQLPSADRTCDKETNKTTFYYSNMTSQIGKKLNQSIWADLEGKVRSWVSGTDTVFVVTGAMPPADGNIQREKEMAVPAYYFKALARKVGGTFYTIAFKMDNQPYDHRNYMSTAISVSALEQQTGFTFFPMLDAEAKQQLDLTKWN
ncbi:MAG: fimbrillin family protein [Bacteroides sp.]|nr:fimbrillin family protein [Bacteroides sp.]